MVDNQDLTIPEEDALEDTEVQEEEETQEMIEAADEDVMIKMEAEIATADVVDGNTVKLKDSNNLLILR
jgi:hypothetical protein